MTCEYCGKETDEFGDVCGAIVCMDCLPEAERDQGVEDVDGEYKPITRN